ncbi:MAG: hypothetical protein H7288_23825 [Kineosporiaceae bacterium]|nr:hypothetical protein [Aeromicrobium sp.]
MAGSGPNKLSKFAAISMLSLGLVSILAVSRLFDAASYIGLATLLIASLSLFCGVWLWASPGFVSRLVAVLIASLAALGQGLNTTIGLPGASALAGKSGATFWLALTFELLTVLFVTVDRLRKKPTLNQNCLMLTGNDQKSSSRRGR